MRKFGYVSIICTLFATAACSVINALAAEIRVPSEHPSIQDALDNAVSGDTIRLAAGDYYEQFMIAVISNVTILGESGTILHASDQMMIPPLPFQGVSYPIAAVVEGAEATFRNLEFQGHRLSDAYPELLAAIVFRGGSGRIENCTFTGFRGESEKDGRAINVQNDFPDNNDIAHVTILNSRFSDNKISIMLFGASSGPNTLRTRFSLTGNTVFGAQNIVSTGIGIRPGVEGILRGNVIADHSADLGVVANDPDYSSRGFFHPLRRFVCVDNTFSNNAVHFSAIAAHDIVVTNNIFADKAPRLRDWAVTITGTNILLAGNNFAHAPIGVAFPANETLGGISRGGVLNAEVINNWFSNVPLTISTNSLVSNLKETDSQVCCFSPVLKTIERTAQGEVRASVRIWHNKPILIESSTDLKQWISGATIVPDLPQVSFEALLEHDRNAEFFRLRNAD